MTKKNELLEKTVKHLWEVTGMAVLLDIAGEPEVWAYIRTIEQAASTRRSVFAAAEHNAKETLFASLEQERDGVPEPEPEPEPEPVGEMMVSASDRTLGEILAALEPEPEPEPVGEMMVSASDRTLGEILAALEPEPEPEPEKTCALCGTTGTPQWRERDGEVFCNACGIRLYRRDQKEAKAIINKKRRKARRHFPTEKKHAILDEIEAVVAAGGNQKEVLEKHGLYSKGVRRWRTALGRIPLSDLKKRRKIEQFYDRRREHKGAELYVKHLEAGLDAYIARARKKAVKLHKAFVNADSSTLKGAMTKVNSAEDISKILAGLNEYKTEELGEIQLEAVGIVFEQVAAIKEKMLGLVEVPDER